MVSTSLTPMMSQFLKIKSQYSDALLFYRMGDFYEMFFEDAKIAAEALNITLTKRGKHNGQDIPMCGVPCHSSENYLLNLIRKGHKVAVCEQLETPEEAKKRGYKSVVNRDVIRLITPGTLTDEGLLNEFHNNFLLSIVENKGTYGVSWADISTGDFYCSALNSESLLSLISRVNPSEILVPSGYEEKFRKFNLNKNVVISSLPLQNFDHSFSKKRFEQYFSVKSTSILGDFDINEINAMGALLSYLEITQCGQIVLLTPPKKDTESLYLKIDAASRKSLEITQTLDGNIKGSLLGTINKTLTGGGTRLLNDRLNCPSTDLIEITERQAAVKFFIKNQSIMSSLREILKQTPDMQRSLSRLGLSRGSPKDLGTIRNCLRSTKKINDLVSIEKIPLFIYQLLKSFDGFTNILTNLNSALIETPPLSIKEGDYICSEYSPDLKHLRELKKNAQNLVAELQMKYIKTTTINSLKIKYNNILGYFVEIPISQSEKMKHKSFSETFIHRQTTTNSSRFSTIELSNMASDIINAQEKSKELELSYFEEFVSSILKVSNDLNSAAKSLSAFDFYSSLSFLSISEDWQQPIVDQSKTFKIKQGRHPVVDASLRNSASDQFIANNCDLSTNENSILLITGPNMAGKSTFLRQNALITILAQIGSYVPAIKAHIGVVDQIFSRVGASDDLAKGHSTFMIEMIETAGILEKATESSLIIMDEIGRGTATYDGLSIAWATLEHLHNEIRCRTLFATHYHELTQLENAFQNIRNAKIAIREWNDEIIFLHEVKFGTADKSYGIQVAKIAGLPKNVTKRANVILKKLEGITNKVEMSAITNKVKPENDNLTFNNANDEYLKKKTEKSLKVFDMLSKLDTDDITPKEAFNILNDTVLSIRSIN